MIMLKSKKEATEIMEVLKEGSKKYLAEAKKRTKEEVKKAREAGIDFFEEREKLWKRSR